jgi:dipeptidyl aminopeptidase/acylaminoacyl peptidase
MFLTLSKYSGLQNKVDKVVALSSILDLHQQIQDRPDDMKPMFENVYGMNPDHPEKWIKARDPLETIPSIKQTLPILIVQGTEDPRINLAEGEKMVSLLKKTNHEVDYWKVPGGNHTLSNVPTSMNQISKWLEANLDCYRGDPRKYKK